jgi:hypothetical protein
MFKYIIAIVALLAVTINADGTKNHNVAPVENIDCPVNKALFKKCPHTRDDVINELFNVFGLEVNGEVVLNGDYTQLVWDNILNDEMKHLAHGDPNNLLLMCDANGDGLVKRAEFAATGCKCIKDCHEATDAHIAAHMAVTNPKWQEIKNSVKNGNRT